MAFLPLNGPATHGSINVTTTAIEVKVGASPFEERKVITIQPLDGVVYYGYDNTVTSSTGTKLFKSIVFPLEASPSLSVWIIAGTGTVDVRITEAG